MTAFQLKVIALVCMIIDHMGAVFPDIFGLGFRVVGRVAFPVYVFLVAEGFKHTKDSLRFLIRLGIFAVLSEPFFDMAIRGAEFPWGVDFLNNTNIFYTLFLGGLAIWFYEVVQESFSKNKVGVVMGGFFAAFPLFGCMLFAESILTTDYGAYGVLFIFLMYVIKSMKLRLLVMAFMCLWQHRAVLERVFLYFSSDNMLPVPAMHMLMIPATLAAVVLVSFYNGKRGLGFKWFFYASYPVHLAILGFLALL